MTNSTQFNRVPQLSLVEEANLVVGLKTGDQSACAKLVTLFAPQMMAVARRYMRCDDDCDDALQDSFISAFKAIVSFEADSRLSTWLHRITVNSCLMKLRIDSSRNETSIEGLLPTFKWGGHQTRWSAVRDDPSAAAESDETRSAVRGAIDRLPAAHRSVLLLRDIEEMDTVATAAVLQTSTHNVKRRLRLAREALGGLLQTMMAGDKVYSVRA